MKTTQSVNKFACALAVLMLGFAVRAGTISYNFDAGRDYIANGVLGSFWDGVYLGAGDVPLGNNGGSVGFTTGANENTFPNYMAVSARNTGWAGTEDDGFYIYKVVSGDFDVSVQIGANYDNRAFNQSGLLVRAMTTNGPAWGAPFATTVTNRAENWLSINRFNEFSINQQYRSASNGLDIQVTVDLPASTNYNFGTNEQRYVRITRAADTFSVYDRTNISDPWNLQQTVVRGDLSGIPMQVGIHEAEFAGGFITTTYFTDFQLSGPNVNATTPPADASALATSTSDATNGTVTLTWTKGTGADGTLILLQRNKTNFTQVPINGFTFAGNTNFGGGDFLSGSSNSYVAYVGSDSSVTISGLLGSNNVYAAAAFSYTGSGSSIVYGANPAVLNFRGPGIVTNVTFTIAPTTLPLGGVGVASIRAQFTTGDTGDVSTDPNAVLSSSDPSIVLINNGLMNALALGTVQVAVGYAGINSTNTVIVAAPRFTDNFGASQDYVANGLIGSSWDGLFLRFRDIPGGASTSQGGDLPGDTQILDANVSSNNVLTLQATGSSWQGAGDDGPYLFKHVTGDFQASVHITAMNTINLNGAGIMARMFNPANHGPSANGTGAGGETHVNWWKRQAGALSGRRTLAGGFAAADNVAGTVTSDTWLLMQRVNSTNFLMFERASAGDSWTLAATMIVPQAVNNIPMEVGLAEEMLTAAVGTAQFDTLMIDGPGIGSPVGAQPPPAATGLTSTLNGDLSMTFNWVAASNGVPVRSILVVRAGGPVTAQPTALSGTAIGAGTFPFGTGPSLGGSNYVVFCSANPPASTNNTTTLTGLTPGVIYYAAIYTFFGAGNTKTFNAVVPQGGATTNLQDGLLLSVEIIPPPPIPLGGLQVLQVIGHYQGGAVLNVSQFAGITSGDTTKIVTTNGALTGLALGTTTVTAGFGGYTNTVSATVRASGFTDNFNVNHDYVLDRVTGSAWDGVYLNYHDSPESTFNLANVLQQGVTPYAEANISSNSCLTITNQNGGWENAENDGFFLYKYVPEDFQMAVHIKQYQNLAFSFPGIGARAFSYGTNGTDIGAPLELGFTTNAQGAPINGESWVNFTRFDEFGFGTYARLNLSNVVLQSTQNNPNNGDNWLLIIRDHGTNFNFFERATNTAPWRLTPLRTSYSVPRFAGLPMQVGIQWMTFNRGGVASPGLLARFDSFMLDALGPTLQADHLGDNIVLSWAAAPGWTLQSTPAVAPTNWQPVGGTPVLSGSRYTLSLPATSPAAFFRLVH
jgi:regulation of enolase protein 1 (concanavalin A-like superfamily)